MVALILSLAGDANPEVREQVARELGRIGTKSAERELERLLDDPAHAVQVAAAMALTKVVAGPNSLRKLAKVIKSADDLGYDLGVTASKFNEHPAALEFLAQCLDDPEASVRTVCLRLLIKAAKTAPPPSISDLVKPLLADSDPDVALWAAVALWNWELATLEVRSLLTALSKDPRIRAQALGVLAKMEPDEQDRQLLNSALSDPDDGVRIAAAVGLLGLSASTEQALGVLRGMARSPTAQIRYDLVMGLKDLREVTSLAIEELLIRLVADANERVRREAAKSNASLSAKG